MRARAILVLCVTLCYADDARQYRGDNSGAYVSYGDNGQYIPDNSGQYIPDYSGVYRGDGSGRYAGDKSGDYRDSINRNLLGSSTNLIITKLSNPANSIFSNLNRNIVNVPVPKVYSTYNANTEGKWKIIRQLGDVDADGYHWEYETENKIQAEESGKLHNAGTDAEAIRAKGFFEYTGPDNVVYAVTYTADENGFIPQGNHLPTPPPIPAAIVKALKYQ